MRWTLRHYVALALCVLAIPIGVAVADHATGINTIPVVITNQTGSDQSQTKLPFPLSSVQMALGDWIHSDGLNADVLDGSDHAAFMPGTGLVRMLGCFDDSSSDETAECNDSTANDITLPASGSEVYEFASDSQFRILHLNISTPAVADWEIEWQYWNGSAWVALSNVSDGTNHFQNSGAVRVSWDFPAAGLWPADTLNSVEGYWIRAEVAVFTSVTQAPLGQQAGYETGRWWTLAESIGANEQKRYEVHLDVEPASSTTIFPVASAGHDAYVRGVNSATYPPPFSSVHEGTTNILVHNSLSAPSNYDVYSALVRFAGTTAIPDTASVTAATLYCRVSTQFNEDGRNLIWEWYNWGPTVGGSLYETTVQASAHTGTALTEFDGAEYAFELTNLHNVNKNGTTSLRAHIDGGEPTGNNNVVIAAHEAASGTTSCRLEVTYTNPQDFHHYFPHSDGYTVADDASLEPGGTFHLKMAGWFIADSTGSARIIVSKGDRLVLRWHASANQIQVVRNGSVVITSGVLTSGYHVIELTQGGTAAADLLFLRINGTQSGGTVAGVAVGDVADDWLIAPGTSVLALEYLDYEVNQVTMMMHQIRDLPSHLITDHTGNGFDAISRYPDTVAGFSAQVLPLEATGITLAAPPPSGAFVPDMNELPNSEPGEHLNVPTFLPLMFLHWAAGAMNVPYQAMLMTSAFVGTSLLGLIAYSAFRSAHVMYAVMVAGSIAAIFVGDGIWGWVVPITFAVTGLLYVVYKAVSK